MPWRGPCYRLMGWRAGNLPPGDDRGERKSCKGRDGHPVAGAAFAYQSICRTRPTIPPINSKSLITYDFFCHLCYG